MVDVSVIIPCYNAEHFLDECIGSVARQKGVTVEILAVDDASADGTWAKLQALAATTPGLVCEKLPENKGQATARNVAMAKARGRYTALLDSDDSYRADDVLRRWVQAADADALDMCVAQFSRFFTDGRVAAPSRVPLIPGGVGSAVDAPGIANTNQSWQVLFRTAFIAEAGISFSTRLRQREDRLFLIEAFTHAKRVGVTKIDAILYRDHPASTMRRVDFAQLAMFNIHMEIMSAFLAEAREEGRVGADFERANAFAYWRQLLEYWTPLLIAVLEHEIEGRGRAPTREQREIVHGFLAGIQEMTGDCAPLYLDTAIDKPGPAEDLKAEGTMDIARMAIAAGRLDLLLRVLRGQRLHHSALRGLAEAAGYGWGAAAAMQYLKFTQSADFPEEAITDQTPPLARLVKRVILHVGMPKTGSSSLQTFFEEHRFALLERGVYFPVFGGFRERGVRRGRSSGHLGMLWRIFDAEDDLDFGKRLAAEIAALDHPVETLVLSAENILSHVIWPRPGDAPGDGAGVIARIADALGLDQVEIAVVLRRQDVWFQSYYREVTANPFNGFVAAPRSFFNDLHARGLFDYEALLAGFEASDRVAKVHAESFGRMRAAGGSIPWFLARIGLDSQDFSAATDLVTNESLTDAAAANLRILKLQFPERKQAEPLFRQILADEGLARAPFALVSNEDWDEFEARIADELAAFDARYPGEARPVRAEGAAAEAALPVLPALARNEPGHIWLGVDVPGRNVAPRPVPEILGEHAYILSSKSWVVTAPMRRALELARKVRARMRR